MSSDPIATGRVVNDKLTGRLEQLSRLTDKKLFFLGGHLKSGTTWVERILDAHPRVVCKGEAHFGNLLEPAVREALASYNSQITKKGNWARHRRESTQGIPTPMYSFTAKDLDVVFARAIQLMLLKWDVTEEIDCVGEKTPGNSQYFDRLRKLFPAARFVYVVRDIRDVAVSGWFFNLTVNPKLILQHFDDVNKYTLYVTDQWVQHVENGLQFVQQNNDAACFLKYEDLLTRPFEEVSTLFRMIGVETDEKVINHCIAAAAFERLSGGRERGRENRRSFYRKGVIGDWRNHLSAETVSYVESRAQEPMRRLGYV
jgi:hypothetical protein